MKKILQVLSMLIVVSMIVSCSQQNSTTPAATNTPFPQSAFQQPMPEPTNTPGPAVTEEPAEEVDFDLFRVSIDEEHINVTYSSKSTKCLGLYAEDGPFLGIKGLCEAGELVNSTHNFGELSRQIELGMKVKLCTTSGACTESIQVTPVLEYVPVDGVLTMYEYPSLIGNKCTTNTTDNMLGKGFSFHYKNLATVDVWAGEAGLEWSYSLPGHPGNVIAEKPRVALRLIADHYDGHTQTVYTIFPCETYVTVVKSVESPEILITSGTDETMTVQYDESIPEDLRSIPNDLWNDNTKGDGVNGIKTSLTDGWRMNFKWKFGDQMQVIWYFENKPVFILYANESVCYDGWMFTWEKHTDHYSYQSVECKP